MKLLYKKLKDYTTINQHYDSSLLHFLIHKDKYDFILFNVCIILLFMYLCSGV